MPKRVLVRVRVAAIDDVTPLIKLFRLSPVFRASMPPFQAGDHTIVRLADGTLRTYSLCGDPRDLRTYQIAVLREDQGRGGSVAMHTGIHVGDELHVRYPEPGLRLDPHAARHVLIAGGIGITPFLAMVYSHRADLELHYAAKSRRDAAFLPQLRERLGRSVHTYLSARGERLDIDRIFEDAQDGTHIYVCGPERLVNAVQASAATKRRRNIALHLESFEPPPLS